MSKKPHLGLFVLAHPLQFYPCVDKPEKGKKMQLVETQTVESVQETPEFLGGQKFPDLFRKIFLSAPVAMLVLGPGEAFFPNSVCRDLLNETVGSSLHGWRRWVAAAMVRMAVHGSWLDVVAGSMEGRPEVEITVGPEVTAEGHRVLTLRRMGASESRSEDLAETVSTLYHELRTPLTSMKSSLNLVRTGETGPLNDDQEHFLGMTMRNIERLDRLVGDLLDTSRAAAGSLVLNLIQGDLAPILKESLHFHAEAARSAGLEFKINEISTALPVNVDQDKVVQMLANVVSNAIKFTPSGGTVQVETGDGPKPDSFTIVVRDNGPGMDEQALSQVFEPFKRVHDEGNCRVPGAGLGLHITRGLARAHGGDLHLESTLGQGTTVRLVLPRWLETG